MQVLEKQKDISIMFSLGFEKKMIRNIFLINGVLITGTGVFLGLSIAYIVLWLQENYGLINMGMETAIVQAYPIKMVLSDFVLTAITMMIVSLSISLYPARKAMNIVISENV